MADQDFPTTRPTLVQEASNPHDPIRAQAALRKLCEHYYDAIVAYMRRRLPQADAQDAAHEFVQHWLDREESPLKDFQQRKIRFRNFLKVCLRNFVNDWFRRQPREVPLPESYEELTRTEADDSEGCDLELAQDCATKALRALRDSWCAKPGPRASAFPVLARIVFLEDATPHEEIAALHRVPLSTVRGWVLSLRREYAERFCAEVGPLVDRDELADECRRLFLLVPVQRDGKSFYSTLPEFFR